MIKTMKMAMYKQMWMHHIVSLIVWPICLMRQRGAYQVLFL